VNAPLTSASITSPSNGATIGDDRVTVSGTLDAPPNSGVTVNGIVAAVDGGTFHATDVPLGVGPNTLTAMVTTQDGQIATQAISVQGTGPRTWKISATPTQGLSPLSVRFAFETQATLAIQSVQYATSGSGGVTASVSQIEPTAITLLYTGAGTITTTVTFTDSQGNVFGRSVPIVVIDPAALDQLLRNVWNGMANALTSGNKQAAMQYLNSNAQEQFGPVFDALLPNMASIVSSFSPIQPISLAGDMAEYAVVRPYDGTKQLYLIYFVRSPDGVWRIDEM